MKNKDSTDIEKKIKENEIKAESDLIFENEIKSKLLKDQKFKPFRKQITVLMPLFKEMFVSGNVLRHRLDNK